MDKLNEEIKTTLQSIDSILKHIERLLLHIEKNQEKVSDEEFCKELEGLTGMEWRRFELLTENEQERERLERVLKKSSLSRQDLAVILFGLRVRSGFEKEDFGI